MRYVQANFRRYTGLYEGRAYTYTCNLPGIKPGDFVDVETGAGAERTTKTVKVVKVTDTPPAGYKGPYKEIKRKTDPETAIELAAEEAAILSRMELGAAE